MHWDAKHPKKALVRYAQRRATKEHLECTVTENDFDYPEYCPILGLKLKTANGPYSNSSATLDRINIDLGYIKGNIWVVSRLANAMKANSRFKDRALFTNWVLKTLLLNQKHMIRLDSGLIKSCHEFLSRKDNAYVAMKELVGARENALVQAL